MFVCLMSLKVWWECSLCCVAEIGQVSKILVQLFRFSNQAFVAAVDGNSVAFANNAVTREQLCFHW